MRPINQAMRQGIFIVLLGGALAFALTYWAGDTLFLKPARVILNTIDRWRAGDSKARTGMEEGRSEMSQIGFSIDQSMEELVMGRQARRAAEEQRELMARELQHRVKNLFSVVQAIASRTLRGKMPDSDLESFRSRLIAMAIAQDQVMSGALSHAELETLIAKALEPFGLDSFDIEGVPMTVSSSAATVFALALHELSTNAVKYGSLRTGGGKVRIRWRHENDQFVFSWTEQGGAPPQAPKTKGFGSLMIERMLAGQLEGTVEMTFPPEGMQLSFTAPLRNVQI